MRDRDRRHRRADPEESDPPSPEAQGDGEPAPDESNAVRNSGQMSVPDDGDAPPVSEGDQQLAEQRDKYLRLAAEYDNFRRRSARERAETASRAQAELVSKLIDTLDDLRRFAHVDPATTDPTTLHKGITLVEQKTFKVLDAAGLTVINPLDQNFDPNLHEAVATEPALSSEDDHTIAKVLQAGYMFNGMLLRPARVVVKQWQG